MWCGYNTMQLCRPVARAATAFSSLIYWPIFPPLDCVSYQWLDICYIWIIAIRGSNVILMTDIHQSINVGCQSHAESRNKEIRTRKTFPFHFLHEFLASTPGVTNGRFCGPRTPYLDDRHSEMKDGCQSETWDDQRWNPITISRSVSNHQHFQPPKLDP